VTGLAVRERERNVCEEWLRGRGKGWNEQNDKRGE
jgi:hypothetical protein